jgi:hypothetical protein
MVKGEKKKSIRERGDTSNILDLVARQSLVKVHKLLQALGYTQRRSE